MNSENIKSNRSSRPDRRHHPRMAVHWPVVVYTHNSFAHGTVVDVGPLAWRIQASLHVHPGVQLGIQVWPQQGALHLEIEEATVLWASGQEFAIEIDRVRGDDEPAMLQLQERTIGLSPGDYRTKYGIAYGTRTVPCDVGRDGEHGIP
jgi:hypothetical protein